MTASNDMSTPVTRGELREELAQLETHFDHKLDQLETRVDHKLDQLENRVDKRFEQLDQKIEVWGGALLARIESGEERLSRELASQAMAIQSVEERLSKELASQAMAIQSVEERLSRELAGHARAIQEAVSSQISVIDEKYADLPGRVGRLEAAVFKPRRR